MGNDRQFRLLCDYIGRRAGRRRTLATAGQRSVNRAVLKPLLEHFRLQRDGQELADALMAIGVPAALGAERGAGPASPAHRAPRDGGEDGRLPGPGAPVKVARRPATACAAGRGQGFHVTDGCPLLPGLHVRALFYACVTGKVLPRVLAGCSKNERFFTTKTTTPIIRRRPPCKVELKVTGKPVSADVPPNTLLVIAARASAPDWHPCGLRQPRNAAPAQ